MLPTGGSQGGAVLPSLFHLLQWLVMGGLAYEGAPMINHRKAARGMRNWINS